MSGRILIIEDNLESRQLLTFLLKAFGHIPREAADGTEGWALASSTAPDLCLCDIQLPGMNGFEIAARWRSDPVLRSVPLVAVTAMAHPGDRESLLAAGFDAYISKPIEPETFLSKIEVWLPAEKRSAGKPASVTTDPAGP